jgi:nucleotide-binding universal stress UspA family protein
MLTTVTTATPSTGSLHLVVGYDGSPPASRALDAAVNLVQGRTGHIDVVYVAHLSSLAMLSPGAIAEMELDFDEIEQQLRAAAAEQLRGGTAAWGFERRQGTVPQELIAVATAIGDAGSGSTVAIVVGSSSHATHRVVGSVAVSLARHSQAGQLSVHRDSVSLVRARSMRPGSGWLLCQGSTPRRTRRRRRLCR